MKTAIIGGTGFIGTALIQPLLESGREILVFGRRSCPDNLSDAVAYIQTDCLDSSMLAKQLKDVNEIIDLSYATTPKTSFDNPMEDLISNLPRAISIFEACKSLQNLHKIIIVSSGGTVYGKVDSTPISENHSTNPISPYGITKLTQEKYAQMYHQLYGIPVIVLRPSNCYGPKVLFNETQGFVNISISKALKNEVITIFSKKGTIRDYLYIDDLIAAFMSLLASGKVGTTYNVGTGIGLNNLEVLEQLRSLTVPHKIILNYRILHARSFDVPINILDSSKLSRDTGWHQKVSFTDGLKKTWQWFWETQK
jgi:UDP-glucose 4-epimerase